MKFQLSIRQSGGWVKVAETQDDRIFQELFAQPKLFQKRQQNHPGLMRKEVVVSVTAQREDSRHAGRSACHGLQPAILKKILISG
jgi:hypothetical protein